MTESAPIVVVGAGLAGLTAALRLGDDHDVVVLEASDTAGGKLDSERKDGYLFEWGPHSFLGSATHLFALVERLGIDHQLVRAEDVARRRYVHHRGALRTVPSGPVSLVTSSLLSPLAKIRALLEPWVAPRVVPQETAAQFCARRFGPRVAERLLAPFVSGIYAGDARELELAAAFPRLQEFEREHGSVLVGAFRNRRRGGRRGTYSFVDGMQTVAHAAAEALGSRLRTGVAVRSFERRDDRWLVHVPGEEPVEARHVIVTTPAPVAARILTASAGHRDVASVGGLLATIPYTGVGLVQLGCARDQLPRSLDGFGFLTTPDSDLGVLGSLWPSSVFPGRAPNGKSLLTVFVGGRMRPDLEGASTAEITELARIGVGRGLGGTIEPEIADARWVDAAIPQYVRGHRRKVEHIERRLNGSGITLAGNYLHGISVDQATASGERVARRVHAEIGA